MIQVETDVPPSPSEAAASLCTAPSGLKPGGTLTSTLTEVGTDFDAAGGWWDAGDYLKFVETTSYTVAMMLSGIKDFPEQMGARGATDFTAEAFFGLQWLMQMWDDPTQTLYYQVGLGNGTEKKGAGEFGDHDIWRLPQDDDTYDGTNPAYIYIRNRPVFRAAAAGKLVSPNLAGRLAAAFAECYLVYANSTNATYRAMAPACLLAAEHVYALADSAPTGKLLTTIPYSFYPEIVYQDDMELGGTELYFALAAAIATGMPSRRLAGNDTGHVPRGRRNLGRRLHHEQEVPQEHAQPVRRLGARPL